MATASFLPEAGPLMAPARNDPRVKNGGQQKPLPPGVTGAPTTQVNLDSFMDLNSGPGGFAGPGAPTFGNTGIAGAIVPANGFQLNNDPLQPYISTNAADVTAELSLSPNQQRIFDLTEMMQTLGLEEALGRLGNLESEAPLLGADAFSQDRQATSDALYESLTGRLNPEMQFQEDRLRQSLADRGLGVGSEAFGREIGLFRQGFNDQFRNAALQSQLAGSQEQQRLLQNAMANRGTLFNEAQALFGGSQIQPPNLGQFFAPGTADVLGTYNTLQAPNNAAFNAQQQQLAGKNAGMTQLGSSALMAMIMSSSSAFKRDIQPLRDILDKLKRLDVRQKWRYHWEDTFHIGPMAQQWKEVMGIGDGATIHLHDVAFVILGALTELTEKLEAHHG